MSNDLSQYKKQLEATPHFKNNIKPFLNMTDKEIEDLPEAYRVPLVNYKKLP